MVHHYTPPNVARRMARMLSPSTNCTVIDPACGGGELLLAVQKEFPNHTISLIGIDMRKEAISESTRRLILTDKSRPSLRKCDFLSIRPAIKPRAKPGDLFVIMNPPFRGYGRMSKTMRARIREQFPFMNGRFNLADAFVAKALSAYNPTRIVAIVPANWHRRLSLAQGAPTVTRFEVLPARTFDAMVRTALVVIENGHGFQESTVGPPAAAGRVKLYTKSPRLVRQGVATGADDVFIRIANQSPPRGITRRCVRGRDVGARRTREELKRIWIPTNLGKSAQKEMRKRLGRSDTTRLASRFCTRQDLRSLLEYHEKPARWFLGQPKILVPEICSRLSVMEDPTGALLPLHSTIAIRANSSVDVKILSALLNSEAAWRSAKENCSPMAGNARRITVGWVRSYLSGALPE